jgi:hypothetical protein
MLGGMTKTEFYDQKKWLEIHRQADSLVATKNGEVLAAIYNSPVERTRQDRDRFVEMLQDWSATS